MNFFLLTAHCIPPHSTTMTSLPLLVLLAISHTTCCSIYTSLPHSQLFLQTSTPLLVLSETFTDYCFMVLYSHLIFLQSTNSGLLSQPSFCGLLPSTLFQPNLRSKGNSHSQFLHPSVLKSTTCLISNQEVINKWQQSTASTLFPGILVNTFAWEPSVGNPEIMLTTELQ